MYRIALMIACWFSLTYGGEWDSQHYLDAYNLYSLAPLDLRQLNHTFLVEQLKQISATNKHINLQQIGTSVEGRNIYDLSFGRGSTRILLWSQMHGDENTATAALLAVFHYLAANPDGPLVNIIYENLDIHAVPMLNPDGAEMNQRYNAWDIDINRDARVMTTPEAQLLKHLRDKLKPDYGFNLHDMMGREMVDENKKPLYLAFMAPPFNKEDEDNAVRLRAKKLVVYLRNLLQPLIPDHIARYDADYMPRAFGDAMQNWGTSTVLIESGLNDTPDPHFLARLNFLALLSAFNAIASDKIEQTDPADYEQIPLEGESLFDLLIRDALICNGNSVPPFKSDIGINIESRLENGREIRTAAIAEIGDLSLTGGLQVIAGENLVLTPGWIVKIKEVVADSILIKKGITTAVIKAEQSEQDGSDFIHASKNFPDSMILEPPGHKVFTIDLIPFYTSIPAAKLTLENLGQIKRGRQADLLIFEGIKDKHLDLSRLLYVVKNGMVYKVP